MPRKPPEITANQLVAYNLRRARELRGLTQEEAADALEPLIGVRWSKTTFSAAERSYDGERIRLFSADDLLAFSRAFDVPLQWFFFPPPTTIDVLRITSGGSKKAKIADLMDCVFGKSSGDLGPLRDRMREMPQGTIFPDISRRLGRQIAAAYTNAKQQASERLRAAPALLEQLAEDFRDLEFRAFSVDVVTGKTILDKEPEE